MMRFNKKMFLSTADSSVMRLPLYNRWFAKKYVKHLTWRHSTSFYQATIYQYTTSHFVQQNMEKIAYLCIVLSLYKTSQTQENDKLGDYTEQSWVWR